VEARAAGGRFDLKDGGPAAALDLDLGPAFCATCLGFGARFGL
jgi:hypothetical protein